MRAIRCAILLLTATACTERAPAPPPTAAPVVSDAAIAPRLVPVTTGSPAALAAYQRGLTALDADRRDDAA